MQLARTLQAIAVAAALVFECAPVAAYHPEPRVIVTVTELKGGHEASDVQRAAREAWSAIVGCYKQHGKRQRGTLTLRIDISAAGQVVAAQRLRTTLNDEASKCLAKILRARPMPKGRGGSRAVVDIELAPGDR